MGEREVNRLDEILSKNVDSLAPLTLQKHTTSFQFVSISSHVLLDSAVKTFQTNVVAVVLPPVRFAPDLILQFLATVG